MSRQVQELERYSYGQSIPEETPELIEERLRSVDEEIEKLSEEDRHFLELARERCPDQVSTEAKLSFLRSDVKHFDPKGAAQRMAKYWEKRVEICGEEKAFLPMTIDGVCKDDWAALMGKFMAVLPGVKDPMGRPVVHMRLATPVHGFTHESVVRAVWYNMHIATEETLAQKHGVIFLVDTTNVGYRFDRSLVSKVLTSLIGIFPSRIAAFHVIRLNTIAMIGVSFIKFFFAEHQRNRVRFHRGADKVVMSALSMYGLETDMLPKEIGGGREIDYSQWLEDRRAAGL